MTLSVAVESSGVRVPLARSKVLQIARQTLAAEHVRHAMLSITFVTRRMIARLNSEHLGHRGATDVISFGFDRGASRGPVVGDIYISPEVARENARRHGEGVRTELSRLVIHGVLHVLGHEHPEGAERESSRMWIRQEQLVKRLTLNSS
jgi:probable rRNA maturation factor